MPRKTRQVRDPQHEAEVLNSRVNLTGEGEDPVLKAVLSDEFASMPDAEALDVALALQQLIRGQASMLANQEKLSAELEEMRRKQAEYDQDRMKWEQDRKRFLEEVSNRADRIRGDRIQQASSQARGGEMARNAISQARAELAAERLAFSAQLARMPKEVVVSPGVIEMKTVNGSTKPVLMNEIIRIKDHVWVLKPGVPIEVPSIVAQELRNRHGIQEQTDKIKEVLDADAIQENTVVAKKLKSITQEKGMIDNFPTR